MLSILYFVAALAAILWIRVVFFPFKPEPIDSDEPLRNNMWSPPASDAFDEEPTSQQFVEFPVENDQIDGMINDTIEIIDD